MKIHLILSLLYALFAVGFGLAEDAQLDASQDNPPEEVSENIRETVDPTSYSVSLDEHVSASFWFCKEPQVAASPSSELGVNFGQLQPGSLIGVVQLRQPWADYKGHNIQSGTYTMRYGVMPADGNHMGVSPYRDYLLLIPAKDDTDPEKNLSYTELLSSSALAAGVSHPAVLALFPVWEEISEPRLTKNEMDQWTLAIKLGDQLLGLVVAGQGEI